MDFESFEIDSNNNEASDSKNDGSSSNKIQLNNIDYIDKDRYIIAINIWKNKPENVNYFNNIKLNYQIESKNKLLIRFNVYPSVTCFARVLSR